MRKISVRLDEISSNKLDEVMEINNCTISDVVNTAIIAFAQDKQPVMVKNDTSEYDEILAIIGNLDEWCAIRSIDKTRLKYLVKRTLDGHNVTGFGNTKNKWRDKQDDRLFKTHTAWIAHCLKEDFGIEL
jgi:hypothetical protein